MGNPSELKHPKLPGGSLEVSTVQKGVKENMAECLHHCEDLLVHLCSFRTDLPSVVKLCEQHQLQKESANKYQLEHLPWFCLTVPGNIWEDHKSAQCPNDPKRTPEQTKLTRSYRQRSTLTVTFAQSELALTSLAPS